MDKTNGLSRRAFFGFMTAAPLAAASISDPQPLIADPRPLAPSPRPLTPDSPETILLKDYRPHSLYKVPETQIAKAKFPIIDMHSHDYAKTDADVAEWVQTMDEVGVERTVILSGKTGFGFDTVYEK